MCKLFFLNHENTVSTSTLWVRPQDVPIFSLNASSNATAGYAEDVTVCTMWWRVQGEGDGWKGRREIEHRDEPFPKVARGPRNIKVQIQYR